MDVKERLIVQKLRNGEQDAYRYLYDRHYVVLCQFANELVGDPFLAETIVGDVIFHLWEIRETLDINSSLRAYLMRAVRNRCYNHISSEKEKKEVHSLAFFTSARLIIISPVSLFKVTFSEGDK